VLIPFYRARDALCALRGIATVSRLSVCLSICPSVSGADVPTQHRQSSSNLGGIGVGCCFQQKTCILFSAENLQYL